MCRALIATPVVVASNGPAEVALLHVLRALHFSPALAGATSEVIRQRSAVDAAMALLLRCMLTQAATTRLAYMSRTYRTLCRRLRSNVGREEFRATMLLLSSAPGTAPTSFDTDTQRRRRRTSAATDGSHGDAVTSAVAAAVAPADGSTPTELVATLDPRQHLVWLPELEPTAAMSALRTAPLPGLLHAVHHLCPSPASQPLALIRVNQFRHLSAALVSLCELAPGHCRAAFAEVIECFAEVQAHLKTELHPASSASAIATPAATLLACVHTLNSILTVARAFSAYDRARAAAAARPKTELPPALPQDWVPLAASSQAVPFSEDMRAGHLGRVYSHAYDMLCVVQHQIHTILSAWGASTLVFASREEGATSPKCAVADT
jgi:hypothetical protein